MEEFNSEKGTLHPEESSIIDRYVTLQGETRRKNLSEKEREEIATKIDDLLHSVENSKGVDEKFKQEMLAQIKGMELDFSYLSKIERIVYRLENEPSKTRTLSDVYPEGSDLK